MSRREVDEILDALGLVDATPADPELAAARDVGHLLEILAARQARNLEAERAEGYRHFTLLHGDLESEMDVRRHRRLAVVAESAGALLATRGGNDWTCWILRGAGSGPTMLALEGACLESGASWWRWSTDGTMPSFR